MKKRISKRIVVSMAAVIVIVMIQQGCKKKEEDVLPANPFSGVDYGTLPADTAADPNSLAGLHKNIFQTRCAIPGCHDGNFEPDFRTPQSTYATLVYHPIIKNNAGEIFDYRVVPYKPLNSVLYERITNCCFVNQDDRMPQDNIGVPLGDSDILAIKTWIENGAKDISGNVAEYPNLPPNISPFYAVVDAATYQTNYAEETNRIDSVSYNSFYLPDSTNVIFAFIISDDSTAYQQLQVNQLKLSFDPDDFNTATTLTAQYVHVPPPNATDFFGITINTASLPHGQIVYMRYFVNDGDNPNTMQFPTDNLPLAYKTFWSFYIP